MNGLEMREAIRTGADVFTSTEHLLAGRAQEKKKIHARALTLTSYFQSNKSLTRIREMPKRIEM